VSRGGVDLSRRLPHLPPGRLTEPVESFVVTPRPTPDEVWRVTTVAAERWTDADERVAMHHRQCVVFDQRCAAAVAAEAIGAYRDQHAARAS
jgi:hypothetical protein